jgi:hypothetical protein
MDYLLHSYVQLETLILKYNNSIKELKKSYLCFVQFFVLMATPNVGKPKQDGRHIYLD